MGEYVDEIIKNVPALSKKEQLKRVKAAQKGDITARDDVIMSNLRLIRKQAYYYSSKTTAEFDDLFQEGILGCIAAIETYDFKKNYNLSTHIYMYVDKWILKYCEAMSRIVRIPSYKQTIFNKIKKEIERIGESNLYKYSYQQLAKRFNVSRQDIAEYMMYQQPHISINSPIIMDNKINSIQLEETLTDNLDIHQLFSDKETLNKIEKLLDTEIKEVDAEIFKRKFGLGGYKEISTLEICYELRMSKKEVNESLNTSITYFRNILKRNQQN